MNDFVREMARAEKAEYIIKLIDNNDINAEFLFKWQIDFIRELCEQQINNGWIPCSDRKPEFDQNCLVTTDNEEVLTSKFYGYGEECQGYKEYPEGVWEINQCDIDVIAWQPLPEKYAE